MNEQIQGLIRTHHCGELRKEHKGTQVTVCGWVNKYRDLGGLHFIDLRDRHGLVQLGFESFEGDLSILKEVALEAVVMAKGVVTERPESAINKDMPTGEVEVQVKEFQILSNSEKDSIPFLPYGTTGASEDLRLKYRYLDLRTKELQDILALRSRTSLQIRQLLTEEGFIEVETPILYKSTPEGARDYIVPSRVHPGAVYALPQSPQTLKQLLMIGGTDKYFQICKCFRDEDLRADRQPEFTQVDIEVSFATQEYMKNLVEVMVKKIYDVPENFSLRAMSYDEAMMKYGSDKPDLRFGLEHLVVNDLFKESEFATFKTVCEADGMIKALFVPASMGTFSRKIIDALTEAVKVHKAKGLAWFKVAEGNLAGGISKFISNSTHEELNKLANVKEDGTWFFVADESIDVVHASMDALRRKLGKDLELIQKGYEFVWIYDWPLLQWDEEEKRFYASHHPFTAPKSEDLDAFMSGDIEKLKACRADAYDIVCNGYELGGGSVRIFDQVTQDKMFEVLGIESEERQRQFGFFLEALKYGTPPHAGIAFGLDRMIMLLAGTDNIRDVIAFPKTASASDLMSEAPSIPSDAQLDELKMKFQK